MLGRRNRFHGYNSLRGVYARGQTARAPLINLRFARRDPAKPYRVAVVVSRKVHKSAVTRNRIRRRIYEAVRRNGQTIKAGTDLVFTVFDAKVAELPADELEATLQKLLQKANGA